MQNEQSRALTTPAGFNRNARPTSIGIGGRHRFGTPGRNHRNPHKYGWFYHFKFGMRNHIGVHQELMITAASIGTKRSQTEFTDAVNDVVHQTIKRQQWATSFWPAHADPCLQLADYCTWAIQRKWERGDARSYDLIKSRITYEFELWKKGTTHYY